MLLTQRHRPRTCGAEAGGDSDPSTSEGEETAREAPAGGKDDEGEGGEEAEEDEEVASLRKMAASQNKLFLSEMHKLKV